jgi:anti-sigma factor RsiW
MRCAQVEPLVERYVDGVLEASAARQVGKHVRTCVRCTARMEAARSIAAVFAAAPAVRAPRGFADKVMDAVYRQGLSGTPRAVPDRFYRKLGLSFVLTSAVLAMSLFIPPAAYSALVGNGAAGTAFSRESTGLVKGALDGADNTVRAILRQRVREGSGR